MQVQKVHFGQKQGCLAYVKENQFIFMSSIKPAANM
jgi:hypothetical protein